MEGFKNDPIILKALLYHEAERKKSIVDTRAGATSPNGPTPTPPVGGDNNLPTPTRDHGSRSPSIIS